MQPERRVDAHVDEMAGDARSRRLCEHRPAGRWWSASGTQRCTPIGSALGPAVRVRLCWQRGAGRTRRHGRCSRRPPSRCPCHATASPWPSSSAPPGELSENELSHTRPAPRAMKRAAGTGSMFSSAASTPPLLSVKVIGRPRSASSVVTQCCRSPAWIGASVCTTPVGSRSGSARACKCGLRRPPAVLTGEVAQIERQNADGAEKHAAEKSSARNPFVEAGKIADSHTPRLGRLRSRPPCRQAGGNRLGLAHGLALLAVAKRERRDVLGGGPRSLRLRPGGNERRLLGGNERLGVASGCAACVASSDFVQASAPHGRR